MNNCPTCKSPAPHLHPAMQFEGEVQPCKDKWHEGANIMSNCYDVPVLTLQDYDDVRKFARYIREWLEDEGVSVSTDKLKDAIEAYAGGAAQ